MRCANPASALWLQSTRPAGRVAELGSLEPHMRTLLLVVVLGLWPLWFAVVWVVAAALHYAGSQHDYWSAAPWVIFVSIPVCVATTLLAFAARYVFHVCDGGTFRKSILAGLVYVGAFLLLYNLSGADMLKEFGFKK